MQTIYVNGAGLVVNRVIIDASVRLSNLGHVNVGPEHMPLGLADHLDHLRRLASRGQRDES